MSLESSRMAGKRLKHFLFYSVSLIVFTLVIYFVLEKGVSLQSGKYVVRMDTGQSAGSWKDMGRGFALSSGRPLAVLILQMIVILLVARCFAYLFKRMGQPQVIGEILAGIVLGPSVLGLLLPQVSAFLFPAASVNNLEILSQVGLILFMFVVGLELDLNALKHKIGESVLISHASMVFPFTLGIITSWFTYTRFAPEGTRFISFSLFMGIAMSITAFPVLARIVYEKKLSGTKLGNLALTAAAIGDVTAWCVLAAVIAVVKATGIWNVMYMLLSAVLYVILMLKLLRPMLLKYSETWKEPGNLPRTAIIISFLLLLISSYIAELIGIHALFGAFLAGAILPAPFKIRNLMAEKIEDVSLVLLLPLFFVITGLRTRIGLLNDSSLWIICTIITLIAIAGKFAGTSLAARLTGQSWRDSLSVGALMNTRGLMELVVLNIGYDLGVLSAEIFSMLVIMALVTTIMTGPALDMINRIYSKKSQL